MPPVQERTAIRQARCTTFRSDRLTKSDVTVVISLLSLGLVVALRMARLDLVAHPVDAVLLPLVVVFVASIERLRRAR